MLHNKDIDSKFNEEQGIFYLDNPIEINNKKIESIELIEPTLKNGLFIQACRKLLADSELGSLSKFGVDLTELAKSSVNQNTDQILKAEERQKEVEKTKSEMSIVNQAKDIMDGLTSKDSDIGLISKWYKEAINANAFESNSCVMNTAEINKIKSKDAVMLMGVYLAYFFTL